MSVDKAAYAYESLTTTMVVCVNSISGAYVCGAIFVSVHVCLSHSFIQTHTYTDTRTRAHTRTTSSRGLAAARPMAMLASLGSFSSMRNTLVSTECSVPLSSSTRSDVPARGDTQCVCPVAVGLAEAEREVRVRCLHAVAVAAHTRITRTQ